MNDTTLPIPKQNKSTPRRRSNNGAAGVRPGFGLHDWMTLLRRAKDLAQRKGAPLRRDIPLSEVNLHDEPYDAWMVLRGKVYNVSPYLAYHPGGAAIVEACAGTDATALFDRYHSWVNLDGLVGPLLLGYLKAETKRAAVVVKGGITGGDGDGGDGGMPLADIGESEDESDDESEDGDDDIVMPGMATTTTTIMPGMATNGSANDLGFAMPKPRPPKGAPITSLLPPPGDNDDDDEDVDMEDASSF